MSEVDVKVALEIWQCRFGHVYAVPDWITPDKYVCPICASDAIRDANRRTDEALYKAERLERTITGLRGALTKAKKEK